MASASAHSALRSVILARLNPEEELELVGLVRHSTDTIMVGYGDICCIRRHGKRGFASVVDQFDNLFHLSELSEDECREILSLIPA